MFLNITYLLDIRIFITLKLVHIFPENLKNKEVREAKKQHRSNEEVEAGILIFKEKLIYVIFYNTKFTIWTYFFSILLIYWKLEFLLY